MNHQTLRAGWMGPAGDEANQAELAGHSLNTGFHIRNDKQTMHAGWWAEQSEGAR